MLEEFTIEGTGRRELIRRKGSALELKAAMMSEMPTLLGGGDVLSAMRTSFPVATASDLTASFSVRGLPTGASLYTSDGIRMGNPLHLLGLYSTFTPGLYDSYILDTFPDVCLPHNTSAAAMGALTEEIPDTIHSGSFCIGLIESHAHVSIPLSRRHPASAKIAIRQSYLDKVFPGLLRAGSSTLGYSFTDGGAVVNSRLSAKDLLNISFTGSRDKLMMRNGKVGRKEADSGWGNIAAGAKLTHARSEMGIGFTYFSNHFEIEEGLRSIKLPSRLMEITAYGTHALGEELRLHIDGHMRKVSGQGNEALPNADGRAIPGKSTAWELSAAASWNKSLSSRADLYAGLRLSAYIGGSERTPYTCVTPQPRVSITMRLPWGIGLTTRYARLVRYDRLLEESATGMPVNFFINTNREVRYEDNHSLELNLNGTIPSILIDWDASTYWIRMINAAEYGGGLLSFMSYGYNPISDLHYGNGYSAGMSVRLMRQWGKFRGRVQYTFGRSRVRIPYFSSHYFPSSSDRTHDLSAGLTWNFLKHFTLSGKFTYATGTPYTKARYGYIIGENLICEYYPHNSSRLPPYKRLDLSLSYRLNGGRISQEFNVSVYNALGSRNVLFISNSYSLADGVTVKESVMRSVIPSVAYTLHY